MISPKPQIHHIIEIPEQIEPVLPDQCCIYNVPSHLLKLNEEDYTPQFISIGPLHSNNSELKQQEKQKQRYFHAFWKRLSIKQVSTLVQYKAFLEENREKIGSCYSKLPEQLCKDQDQFVLDLLVDKEAIVHELGSHAELATLVNGLCTYVVVNSNYYGKITKELNEHYNSCWKRYMGMLRSVYFRDPWRLSSTIVGVAIFLFAFVNFFRVIGVFHPK